ncbi:MAG: hypothetical protein ACE141_06985 [Bryobacteraceae bacterium]
MRKWCKPLFCLAGAWALWAGPVDFGKQELQRAIAERKLPPQKFRVQTEVSTDAPESFRIVGARIAGGDLRGLMYGLLEASEQIRAKGWMVQARGSAAVRIRGVRLLVQPEDLGGEWFYSRAYWDEICSTLARSRFNRLNLVFGGQTELGPRVAGAVHAIAQTALGCAVDLAISLEPGSLDGEAHGFRSLLIESPAIRSVQWKKGEADNPVMRLPEALLGALVESGRRVTLEFPSREATPELLDKLTERGIPLRLSAEHGSAPAAPAEAEVLWEVGAPGARERDDPAFVRGVMQDLTKTGVAGFEIDGPLPVTSEANRRFYTLWGRLSYDPKTPASVWEPKLVKRP